jgi:hypothetical protein
MAHTIAYWYKFLSDEKDTQPTISSVLQPSNDELNNLRFIIQQDSSPSQAVLWRIWTWIIATGYYVLELLQDNHLAEVTFLARKRGQVGQAEWVIEKSKEFQFGDEVKVLEDEYGLKYTGYDVGTTGEKCVKLVAINTGGSSNLIKVANLDVDGNAIPLTNNQRTSFVTYYNKIKPVGTQASIVTAPPDVVKYEINVEVDGQADLIAVRAAIDEAIKQYHQTLDFSGTLRLSRLGDAIQAVQFVKDYSFVLAQIKPDGGSFITFTTKTETYAGYCIVDPTTQINIIAV